MTRPLIRYVVETFDPTCPTRGFPVGRAPTVAEATAVMTRLATHAHGWLHRVVDAWADYAVLATA
jgi:hypothetical protein